MKLKKKNNWKSIKREETRVFRRLDTMPSHVEHTMNVLSYFLFLTTCTESSIHTHARENWALGVHWATATAVTVTVRAGRFLCTHISHYHYSHAYTYTRIPPHSTFKSILNRFSFSFCSVFHRICAEIEAHAHVTSILPLVTIYSIDPLYDSIADECGIWIDTSTFDVYRLFNTIKEHWRLFCHNSWHIAGNNHYEQNYENDSCEKCLLYLFTIFKQTNIKPCIFFKIREIVMHFYCAYIHRRAKERSQTVAWINRDSIIFKNTISFKCSVNINNLFW